MAVTMRHWNGNQVCAVDTETTGLDPHWHEIVQIAILPLDSNFEPRQDVLPFYVNMKPENPERVDREAVKVNRLANIMATAHDSLKAIDMFTDWVDTLGLPQTKWGTPKKILPLGHNWAFDKAFIQSWLGRLLYEDHFDCRAVDTMVTARYLNDRAAMHGQKVPFSKVNLRWIANQYNISHDRAHDALQDAVVTAKCYQQMTRHGLLG